MYLTGNLFLTVLFFALGCILGKKESSINESFALSGIYSLLFAFAILYDYQTRNNMISEKVIILEIISLCIAIPLGMFTGRWFKRKNIL
jgi:membrane-bound ClpP family serine protease